MRPRSRIGSVEEHAPFLLQKNHESFGLVDVIDGCDVSIQHWNVECIVDFKCSLKIYIQAILSQFRMNVDDSGSCGTPVDMGICGLDGW